jgi:glycine/D-amino acid oxidase-like deaminating enzyme
MDLESGRLFWPSREANDARTYVPLARDARCEIAVVGGGISGALAAHSLAEAGADVLLVDQRDVARGSTSATTGLLLYEIDTPLHELATRIGEADAARCYQLCVEANREFAALAAELGGVCEYRPRKCLYFASHARDVGGLREEWAIRGRHGIGVDFLEQGDVAARFSFRAPAALLSHEAAEIDAYHFTHALLRAAVARGLRVHTGTEVAKYEAERDHVVLTTTAGFRIDARRVVFATGYESQQFLKRKIVDLQSTFVIASQPLTSFAGWEERCLIWETARPYLYLRDTCDGRAMIGGEDEPFRDPEARDALIGAKSRRLRSRFASLFPQIDVRPEYAWAGTFGTTRDGLPYIGPTDEFPLGYFALGFGGNGITFSLIAARLIRDHYLGRDNPDVGLFRFDRPER